MSNWQTPVTDRALSDITNRTPKGFFNVADWLRINDDARIVTAIANVMRGLGLVFNELTPPTVTSFPSAADINAFITNIEQARTALCFPTATIPALKTDWQTGASAAAPDYTTVNAWEADLLLLRDYLEYGAGWWTIGAGVGGCGQTRLWQVRFRVWAYVPDAVSPIRNPCGSIATCGAGLTRQNKFRRYA